MKGLNKRVAVVTGAASGIGRAIANRFAEEGVEVFGVDLQVGDMPDNQSFIGHVQVDLTHEHSTNLILDFLSSHAKKCDILVNAAGVSEFGFFDDKDMSLFERTMAVNLEAVARITRAFLPLLRKSNQGRIINIGSICSEFASPGLSAYVISKHAVLGLTRALASELGSEGITVNCIQPGAILTGITASSFEADPSFKEHWANKAAIGRIGEPEDVAPLACFLASEEARFIAGHGIYVDGAAMQQG